MTHWNASAAIWLAQVAAGTLPDTIITRTVAERAGWFETVTSVASGLVSITLLVLTVALVPAAWNFRKSYKRVSQLLDRIYGDVTPIVRHVSAAADNAAYITAAVRADVQDVRAVVADATGRLQEAIALAEERLHALSALLAVAQGEAEDVFVSTAAAVRGVRGGARALHERTLEPRAPRGGDAHGSDDQDDEPDYEEGDDGDDARAAAVGRPRPRIRPRGGDGRRG